MRTDSRRDLRSNADDGVTIVEILVAMAIFGLVMAASVPLFVMAVKSTARSAQLASANQIASQQLERARNAATSCAALQGYLATSSAAAARTDTHGLHYSVSETLPTSLTCPAPAGLVQYTVTVTADVPGKPVKAVLSTGIWVSS